MTGNINSNEKGSGARFNEGKPDYSMVFLDVIQLTSGNATSVLNKAMYELGKFQRTGHNIHLLNALKKVYDHAKEHKLSDDKYFLDPVIRVWVHGAKKYAKWNWAKGMNWSIPIGCIARHYLDLAERGEEIDPESGQPNWAHIICNIQMLILFHETYPEGNDLPYKSIQGGL